MRALLRFVHVWMRAPFSSEEHRDMPESDIAG
jgi:hypothetical protein